MQLRNAEQLEKQLKYCQAITILLIFFQLVPLKCLNFSLMQATPLYWKKKKKRANLVGKKLQNSMVKSNFTECTRFMRRMSESHNQRKRTTRFNFKNFRRILAQFLLCHQNLLHLMTGNKIIAQKDTCIFKDVCVLN